MKSNLTRFFAVAIGLLVVSIPALAHHGNSRYDSSKTITLNGTITSFDWSNPHCLIHMDVRDDNGHVQHWTLELAGTFTMSRSGWTKNSLKPGDQVSAETHPAQNGTTVGLSGTAGSIMKVVVNGRTLPTQ
jgi:hypothetical protein